MFPEVQTGVQTGVQTLVWQTGVQTLVWSKKADFLKGKFPNPEIRFFQQK